MKSIRNRPVAFVIAVMLSFVIHLIALAGVKGVTIAGLHAPDFVVINIEQETAQKGVVAGSIRDVFQKSAQKQGTSVQRGATEPAVAAERDKDLDSEEEQSEEDAVVTAAEHGAETVSPEQSPLTEDGASQEGKTLTAKNEETVREQNTEKPEDKAQEKSDEKAAELALSFREKLNFDLYWLGIYVGKAELETTIRNNAVTITSQAHSAKFLSNFYRVEDYSESRIEDGMPLSFKIRQREGKYRSDKETRFDLKNKKVTYFDHLKDIRNEHDVTYPLLWDVVSGFYYLRIQPLEVGKKVFIHIFDSGKILSVQVDVLRKEKIEVPGRGETDAIIVKPILMSEGLFQKKGDVLIWLTDDMSRIPVKVETEVPIGKVVAKLRTMETVN